MALFRSPIRGWCENASRQSPESNARQISSAAERTAARDLNGLRANIPDTHRDAPQHWASRFFARDLFYGCHFACPPRPCGRPIGMGKLFAFIGSTIGGYAGWALGAPVGFTTAFMVSMVGTGFGMYYGRQFSRKYIE
jgi:hypothetical protein